MTAAHNRLPAISKQYGLVQSAKRVKVGRDLTQTVNFRNDSPYRLVGFDPAPAQVSRARAAELPSRLLRAQFEAIQFVGRERGLRLPVTGRMPARAVARACRA